MSIEDSLAAVQERFPELALEARPLMTYLDGRDSGQFVIVVPPERLHDVMRFLKRDERCGFEQLTDVTCVDYLNYPDNRFGVIYALLSLRHNHRLWVKVFVNDPDPTLASLCPIWKGAEWLEREVYDMFGIRFAGHPDLRRILMPANFMDFPLRKDYPLRGKGEREHFDVITRETTDLAL
jgi:NADH-quinone oxidoreductase subunit C